MKTHRDPCENPHERTDRAAAPIARTRTLGVSLILLVALSVSLPAGASETLTKPYIGGSPSVFGHSVGILLKEGPDSDGDGEPDIPAIGGNSLRADRSYRHALASISDDVFGSNGGYNACLIPQESEFIDAAYCTGNVCGTSALTASPYASDLLNFWTRSVVVQEDLTVCGATTGTFTGTLF